MTLSAEEYARLVEEGPILVWRAEASGSRDYFNQRWLEFRGRTLEQESGDGWREGVHPEDLPQHLQAYLTHLQAGMGFELESRIMRWDGVYRWIADRGVPMFSPEGAFSGYIGSYLDVTERVEAERSRLLRREQEAGQFRLLLPICAWCRKIRDDRGSWQEIEDYLSEHSGTKCTHSICPNCLGIVWTSTEK